MYVFVTALSVFNKSDRENTKQMLSHYLDSQVSTK